MLKWYEETGENNDVVISSKVRLARNFEKYPFSKKLTDEDARSLLVEMNQILGTYEDATGKYVNYALDEMSEIEKMALVERHVMSAQIAKKQMAAGLVVASDETVSVMVNEEDHIRIQSLAGGMNMKQAFKKASEMDDFINEQLKFAFDEKYGYLTSCPTNVGTGLRASYMVFLPALGGANKMNRLSEEAGKYGITLRGVYGEGTNGLANIYQISNQKTLGSTETDIISNLDNIVRQIIRQERKRREYLLNNNYEEIEDQVYRSYGVLKFAKQINTKDAMTLLSQLKFGIDTKIIQLEKPCKIYEMMMAIQPYNIQKTSGKYSGSKLRNRTRAQYINENLPELA